jgi:hypothetical protein
MDRKKDAYVKRVIFWSISLMIIAYLLALKEKIEAARAQMFLVDDQNKTSSPGARWIIGGDKDGPPLAPGATTTYNLVVTTDKDLKVNNVVFSKIILEGGKLADVKKDVVIEK